MVLTWGTNVALNLLYVCKKYLPLVRRLDIPIDRGAHFFDRRRLIGDSTTVLGIVVALLCSYVAFWSSLYTTPVAIGGPLLVYGGHMMGSFIKRRVSEKQDTFVPFIDHGDYIILTGGVLCSAGEVSVSLWIVCLLLTYILHPIATRVAFSFGLREKSY